MLEILWPGGTKFRGTNRCMMFYLVQQGSIHFYKVERDERYLPYIELGR